MKERFVVEYVTTWWKLHTCWYIAQAEASAGGGSTTDRASRVGCFENGLDAVLAKGGVSFWILDWAQGMPALNPESSKPSMQGLQL